MGVEALIDQLEARIRDARKTPLIGGVRIDRWEIYDLLDELRVELATQVRPLDEDRLVRRAAGVWGPMAELSEVLNSAGPKDMVRVDRDRLLTLVGQMREGVAREEIVLRPAAVEYDPAPLEAIVARLETLVAEAPKVPLTPEARFDRDEIYGLIDRMRATLPQTIQSASDPTKARLINLLAVIDALDDSIRSARPVPLTTQVRMDHDKLSKTLKRIRAAFSQGTLAALTN